MTNQKIKEMAEEILADYRERCFEMALENHDGDKVAALDSLQGFDFPDWIAVGEEMEDECADRDIEVPEDAVAIQIITSDPLVDGEFIYSSDSEEIVEQKIRAIYDWS